MNEDDTPEAPGRGPTGDGWRVLREEREREFRTDFAPLRAAIGRNELLSSSVELFLNALVGVTKINLGAPEEAPVDRSDLGAPTRRGFDGRAPRRDDTPPPASEGDTPTTP